MRTLAIGDIHGCRTAFETLLSFVGLQSDDTLITLGDYVDRGPDSKGVIDRLLRLHATRNLIPLRGNHEIMMLGAKEGGRDDIRFWLTFGGVEAIESYSPTGTLEDVPASHWHFMKQTCDDWYETDTHIFVHANLDPDLPVNKQLSKQLHWRALNASTHVPHQSGKFMICGHTNQPSGIPLVLDRAVCIDTHAYGGGWLTCLDVNSGDFWQANEAGETRRGQLAEL